ncbi:MAG: hypothetical protein CEE42_02720 [Promethearchaeota archaeon Loki_b31]|nr:MAG: hypothetical protein CEE42_02720 [Candidatus Lokiarchaeota archaeon Loki_b31]
MENDPEEDKKKRKERAKARAAPTKKKVAKPKKGEEVQKPRGKIVYKKIKVNFWRTRLHDEELGIHQQLKYTAKTRWFSKNFDIEGVIEIDDQKKNIIAFNKEQWEESPIEEKRLVCRYFTIMEETMASTAKGGNFKGGIELSIAHSLIQSFEIKHPGPVFYAQIPGVKSLIRFVRGWRFIGSRWTFPLLPEEKGDKLQMVLAKGVVGPGRNYKFLIGKKIIARIDGHPIQKEYILEIFDEDYAKDKTFVRYMILFGLACNFMDEAKKIVKRLYKKMKSTGTTDYKIPKTELDLFRNPRMMRR